MLFPSWLPNLPPTKPYPVNFENLPPNHNPIINSDPMMTFDDVHATLMLIIRIILDSERLEVNCTERESRGLLCVLQCLADAMKFELYHRVPNDEDEASSSHNTPEDENGAS